MAELYCSLDKGGDAIQLNKSTDYAIRILLYLGRQGEPCSTVQISQEMKIPERETSFLLKKMTSLHILQSSRGKYGGYVLNVHLENISMYDVISWTTKEMKINECLKHPHACSRGNTEMCKVRQCFSDLQILVENRLQSIKLNEFI